MNKSFFNIAWNQSDDLKVRNLLMQYDFSGVELSVAKVWPEPTLVTTRQSKSYKDFWSEKGINITALCSLFYPHSELNIFKSERSRNQTLLYLKQIINLAANLGSKILVFGSPKNRSYQNLSSSQAIKIGAEFFTEAADLCKGKNLIICIEPVPEEYHTNFINTTEEALNLVKIVNHPNFQLHLDTGAMTMNNENLEKTINSSFDYIKHFHISENNLTEIGTGNVDHKKIAQILNTKKYPHWISVEMPNVEEKTNLEKIERVLRFVSKIYG